MLMVPHWGISAFSFPGAIRQSNIIRKALQKSALRKYSAFMYTKAGFCRGVGLEPTASLTPCARKFDHHEIRACRSGPAINAKDFTLLKTQVDDHESDRLSSGNPLRAKIRRIFRPG
jgi:hypothetical protein